MKKLTSFLLATALLLTASYSISIEAATLNYCATPSALTRSYFA